MRFWNGMKLKLIIIYYDDCHWDDEMQDSIEASFNWYTTVCSAINMLLT